MEARRRDYEHVLDHDGGGYDRGGRRRRYEQQQDEQQYQRRQYHQERHPDNERYYNHHHHHHHRGLPESPGRRRRSPPSNERYVHRHNHHQDAEDERRRRRSGHRSASPWPSRSEYSADGHRDNSRRKRRRRQQPRSKSSHHGGGRRRRRRSRNEYRERDDDEQQYHYHSGRDHHSEHYNSSGRQRTSRQKRQRRHRRGESSSDADERSYSSSAPHHHPPRPPAFHPPPPPPNEALPPVRAGVVSDDEEHHHHQKAATTTKPVAEAAGSTAAARLPNSPRNDDDDDDIKNNDNLRSPSFHDDSVGHFRGGRGTIIADRYRIIRDVGIGTFGRVVECLDLERSRRSSHRHRHQQDHHDKRGGQSSTSSSSSSFAPAATAEKDYVAIKIVRKVKRYNESAQIEARIIQDVNRRGGRGVTHCAILHDAFTFSGHFCMVFENLGLSLYDFLKRNKYQPFNMVCIQDFTVQLLQTLEFLHSFRLIHTDLKIENILLVNDRETTCGNSRVPESTHIKVIDFGGACYDDAKKSAVINTRQYRCPEVMLGTGWSMPSDIWSLGCILAELYQGELLFPTHNNIEHLALMERVIGPFPFSVIQTAKKSGSELAREAFDSNGRHVMGKKRILSAESAFFVKKSSRLESIIRNPNDDWFLQLLRRMLVFDPEARATAHECLRYLSTIRRDVVRHA